MLSDRSYMRSDYQREATSALTWIISAVVAGSVLQLVFERFFNSGAFQQLFALTPTALWHGEVWRLVTYSLLHGGLLHFVLNCLGLFLIGREIAPILGSRGLFQFYLSTAVLGGLAWVATHTWGAAPFPLVGASGVLAGMFVFFACIAPEREITFLLFFVLPVTLKPKFLAWALLAIDALGFLFSELPGGSFDTGIAHSAHLGGMLAGWLYYRFFFARNGLDRPTEASFRLPGFFRRKKKAPVAAAAPDATIGVSPPANLRAEVDRILDKINSHGFGALTEQEKRLLDDAKDLLSRR